MGCSPHYRYGFGARSKYGVEYPEWNNELETQPKGEREEVAPATKLSWMQDRDMIRDSGTEPEQFSWKSATDWELIGGR
jgi:hypothetical protein